MQAVPFELAVTDISDTSDAIDANHNDLRQRICDSTRECLEICATFPHTESGRRMIIILIVSTIIISSELIFSTAFATANTVSLSNKSNKILYPTYVSPLGTQDKCGPFILPNTYCTYKFNGINSYMDIQTSNGGTLHINTECKTSLKNGPSNARLTEKGILFWTCLAYYDIKDSNTDDVNNSTIADVEDTPRYLRGV